MARLARNRRLADACYQWAFSALTASPGARAYYDRCRAAGKTHPQALRALANRLVGILHGCLRHRHPLQRAPGLAEHAQQRCLTPTNRGVSSPTRAVVQRAWSDGLRRARFPDRPAGPRGPRCRSTGAAGRRAPGRRAPPVLRRCSIRLSTPPSEVARLKTRTAREHRHGLLLAARQPDRQHAAEPAVHLARPRSAWPGCDGSPGYRTAVSAGCPWKWRARARALSEARCTRRNRVRMPRCSSHASNGPEHGAGVAPPGADALPEGVAAGGHHGTGQHVAVAVEVLGGGMDDQVGAQLDGVG